MIAGKLQYNLIYVYTEVTVAWVSLINIKDLLRKIRAAWYFLGILDTNIPQLQSRKPVARELGQSTVKSTRLSDLFKNAPCQNNLPNV